MKIDLMNGIALAFALCALCGVVAAAPVADPLEREALRVRQVDKAVLLGAASAGARLVAVGERGVIALSDDGGASWRQAGRVPVSVTLTAVQFVDEHTGWATGHAGVVLHTEDGGETWVRQLDGVTLAQAAIEGAAFDPAQAQRALREAKALAADGADKPLLDLAFADARHGIVVGAYNLILATSDGGKSWQSWMARMPNPQALHLYAVRRDGNFIFVAGEQGLLMRSDDGGRTFARVASPYEGSWFALALPSDGAVVVAGLRGHVYRSIDKGENWERIAESGTVSFAGIARSGRDRLVLGNQGGQIFELAVSDNTLKRLPAPPLPALTGLLPLAAGGVLALTAQGPAHIPGRTQPAAHGVTR